MGLEDLERNLSLISSHNFGTDFFLGMSSSIQYNINKTIDSTLFCNTINPPSEDYVSVYKAELIRYKQDIELIKQSEVCNFRFSLSWSRILPQGIGKLNSQAIAFYNDILDICVENEIIPFVTLYDSHLPKALESKGGWSNREMLTWFENYVHVCVNAFKGKVNHWIVFNEPSVFTGASNFLEMYPSGKNSIHTFLSSLHHTLLCQSISVRKIKEIEKEVQVGTFFSCNYVIPISYNDKDLKAVERIDALLNRVFIEPALGLGYPIKTLPFLKSISKYTLPGDDDLIQVDFDFIGLQNCTREVVSHNLFVPYLNAKIVQYDKLRIKKNHFSPQIYRELTYLIVKKYSKYEGVKKIFLNEILSSTEDQNSLNSNIDIKSECNILSFLQQIALANQTGGKVNGYFVST
ncbi:family 1 glycosylhydrolase [Flavobacterium sp.]|uniref:glycoside hydrolase family 1 protein n=1 Tax=Flavobacterium sp. TaxID=239 RepID=UPI00286DE711|nr:family 1 glycosylhydrolase [Flavobacterium sp.]